MIAILGSARVYDIHGNLVINFDVVDNDPSKSNLKLLECQFWGNGIAALCTDMNVHIVEVRYLLSL